jgi:hypothetical protein
MYTHLHSTSILKDDRKVEIKSFLTGFIEVRPKNKDSPLNVL